MASSTGDGGAGGWGDPPPPPVMKKQPSRLASGMKRLASKVSTEMRGLKRTHSSAQSGLRGLRFLDKTSGGKDGWKSVEKRFDEMSTDGRLHKENFAKCIGELPLALCSALMCYVSRWCSGVLRASWLLLSLATDCPRRDEICSIPCRIRTCSQTVYALATMLDLLW